jgi:hypothetical protein
MMRARTGFHANEARRQLRKELHHLIPAQLPAQEHLPSRINPMHLHYVLSQINPDGCNIHGGRSHSS